MLNLAQKPRVILDHRWRDAAAYEKCRTWPTRAIDATTAGDGPTQRQEEEEEEEEEEARSREQRFETVILKCLTWKFSAMCPPIYIGEVIFWQSFRCYEV